MGNNKTKMKKKIVGYVEWSGIQWWSLLVPDVNYNL